MDDSVRDLKSRCNKSFTTRDGMLELLLWLRCKLLAARGFGELLDFWQPPPLGCKVFVVGEFFPGSSSRAPLNRWDSTGPFGSAVAPFQGISSDFEHTGGSMRQKTTAPLCGVAVLGRRVRNSSFRSWSGAKLFRYLVGERGSEACSQSLLHERLSSSEMDRRREQLNQILKKAYREFIQAKSQGARYARPVWTCSPAVTA
jgi:hypothetical protein